jgi:hypothetical protein
MRRFPGRFLLIALTAVVCLVASNLFRNLSAQPQATQGLGETMPGPIIEDPPGPYRGNVYIPARPRGPSANTATFIVTYNGFTPQAQAAFQAAVDVWASQISSTVPIRITANWIALPPGVLGSAGAVDLVRDFPGAPWPTPGIRLPSPTKSLERISFPQETIFRRVSARRSPGTTGLTAWRDRITTSCPSCSTKSVTALACLVPRRCRDQRVRGGKARASRLFTIATLLTVRLNL